MEKRKPLLSARTTYSIGAALISIGLIIKGVYFLSSAFQGNELSVPLPVVTSTLLSFDIASSTAQIPVATSTLSYRLIIPKIGVDMPIVIDEKNETRGLAQGAWQIPGTAVPGEEGGYGNIVLSAHRYLYTSGPRTFFNLDKLEAGDEISIEWLGKTYVYVVDGSAVVPPTAVEILNPSAEPRLTLFTCTPVFTTKNRLVVTAYLSTPHSSTTTPK